MAYMVLNSTVDLLLKVGNLSDGSFNYLLVGFGVVENRSNPVGILLTNHFCSQLIVQFGHMTHNVMLYLL